MGFIVKSFMQQSLSEMMLHRGRGKDEARGCKRMHSGAWWTALSPARVAGGPSSTGLGLYRVARFRKRTTV